MEMLDCDNAIADLREVCKYLEDARENLEGAIYELNDAYSTTKRAVLILLAEKGGKQHNPHLSDIL